MAVPSSQAFMINAGVKADLLFTYYRPQVESLPHVFVLQRLSHIHPLHVHMEGYMLPLVLFLILFIMSWFRCAYWERITGGYECDYLKLMCKKRNYLLTSRKLYLPSYIIQRYFSFRSYNGSVASGDDIYLSTFPRRPSLSLYIRIYPINLISFWCAHILRSRGQLGGWVKQRSYIYDELNDVRHAHTHEGRTDTNVCHLMQ